MRNIGIELMSRTAHRAQARAEAAAASGNWRAAALDLVLGVALFLVISVAVYSSSRSTPVAATLPLIALATLPLAVRRAYPVQVLAVTAAGAGGLSLWEPGLLPLGAAIAVYSVAYEHGRRSVLWAFLFTVVALMGTIREDFSRADPASLSRILLFAAAWFFGESTRARRDRLQELEDRASRLEREREENVARAVAEERVRIARDLHDIVAHGVSVMLLQAEGADAVFDAKPTAARQAIRSIQTAGREAVSELKRVLVVLRQSPADALETDPQPSLCTLDVLAAKVREAGLRVDLSVEGDTSRVPASIQLSAYRVVQEALTNAVRHAQASRASVNIKASERELKVVVEDDGRGPPGGFQSSLGHGLVGMRERVAVFGGQLEAGPGAQSGFVVSARIPLEHSL